MKRFIVGLLLGMLVSTGMAWAFGHTPTDRVVKELRQLRENQELEQSRQRIEESLRSLKGDRPC